MMRWPLGEGGDLVERFTNAFGYFLEEAIPLGLVLEAGDGDGAAVWVPPGVEAPWGQERIGAVGDDGGARYDGFWDWVGTHEPGEPHWLLDSIAVEPALQGQGIGAALIAAGLEKARADGVPAFLSTGTAGNVEIYRRCGFRLVEDLDAPGGGPHVWFMRCG
jgi:GNAT superfamily N-acetyltransferase